MTETTGYVGSLHFTYGRSNYSSVIAANITLSSAGLVCLTLDSPASKYNDQYLCEVLSVDFEQGSCNKELAVIFQVRGDGSLGNVQPPDPSRLQLHSTHSVINLPFARVVVELQNADAISGTLFYQFPDFAWETLVQNGRVAALSHTPAAAAPPTKHHRARQAVSKRSLRLEGVHSADAFSVIGTGGLALSERLIGANEGLRGRITFSDNPAPDMHHLSKHRDDRLLEVLLEQSSQEGLRVGESTHIYDLECVQCCKEVGLCACEVKPCAIGAGAHGSVWKYRRSSDKCFVAIKKVSSCSRFDASWRLDGEAAVMALLAKNGSHHVIPFYGSFVDCDGVINLSMKCLDKGSLADLLSNRRRLVLPAVSILALHLLSALDYFHNDLNLLHRDIKPSNIMIEDDGRFVLADLALAILANSGSQCDSPAMAGTMEYMSPECLNDGVATTASDLWSFGIVLLQAVLGYFPLDFSDATVSSDTSAAPQAELAFDSTSRYWQLHNVLASVKSPIYVPSIRQVLDALGRAYDVEVLDFFDRCLNPVQPNALLLSFSASVLFFSCHAFASFAHFCCTGCKHALKCQGTAVS